MEVRAFKFNAKRMMSSLNPEEREDFQENIYTNRIQAIGNLLTSQAPCQVPIEELIELFKIINDIDRDTAQDLHRQLQIRLDNFSSICNSMSYKLGKYTIPFILRNYLTQFCNTVKDLTKYGLQNVKRSNVYINQIRSRFSVSFGDMDSELYRIKKEVNRLRQFGAWEDMSVGQKIVATMGSVFAFLNDWHTSMYLISFLVFEGWRVYSLTDSSTGIWDVIKKICVIICVLNTQSVVFRFKYTEFLRDIAKTITDNVLWFFSMVLQNLTGINFNLWDYVMNNKWSKSAIKHISIWLFTYFNMQILSIFKTVCTVITNLAAKGIWAQMKEFSSQLASIAVDNFSSLFMNMIYIVLSPITMVVQGTLTGMGHLGSFLWTILQGLFDALVPTKPEAASQLNPMVNLEENLTHGATVLGIAEEAQKQVLAQSSGVLNELTQTYFDESTKDIADKYYKYSLEALKGPAPSQTLVDSLYRAVYGEPMSYDFVPQYTVMLFEWYILSLIFYALGKIYDHND